MSRVTEIIAYRFSGFMLDFARESLFGPVGEIHLRPQAFLLLHILADHAGELVSRDMLMNRIWGPTVVTEASITQCLAELRKALDDQSHELIRTLPRRGYMLDCPVERVMSPGASRRYTLRRLSPALAATAGILLLGNALVLRDHSEPVTYQPETSKILSESPGAGEARAHLERGQLLYGRRQPGDLADALDAFEQAVTLDPGLAEAWTGISAVYFLGLFYPDAPSGGIAAVVEPAERALKLAPDNGMVLTRAARAALVGGDRKTARERVQRAALVAPNDPLVLAETAGYEFSNGNYAEAFRLQLRATQIQPLSAIEQSNLGTYALAAGEYRESIKAFHQSAQLSPEGASYFSLYRALALLGVGDIDGAKQILEQNESDVNRLALQLINDPASAGKTAITGDGGSVIPLDEVMLRGAFHAYRGELELARQSLAMTEKALSLPGATNDTWPAVSDLLFLPWWEPLRQDKIFISVDEHIKQCEQREFRQRVSLADFQNETAESPDGKS